MKEINPHISVDCVIFGFDMHQLKVLMFDRILISPEDQTIIFSDHTLPGNHIRDDEDMDTAAYRILYELTGFSDVYLEQFYTFGSVERLSKQRDRQWLSAIGKDPETRVVTIAYYSLVPVDKVNLDDNAWKHMPNWYGKRPRWYPLDQLGDVAYDHEDLITKALGTLRERAVTKPIIYKLLPDNFTLSQLQKVYEVILDIQLDKRNFRRRILNSGLIVPVRKKQTGVSHKPAELYCFDMKKYTGSINNPLYY
jgi:hypothetical protein